MIDSTPLASRWSTIDYDAINKAWKQRRRVREQAEVLVPSSQYFGDPQKRMAKERGRIEKEIAEADKLLDEAETKHEEATAPLHGRINQPPGASPRFR